MIIFTDKTLAAAGLNFDVARALLAPAAGELLVHVRQVLDGPPVPQEPNLDEPGGLTVPPASRAPYVAQVDHKGPQKSVVIPGPVEGETAITSPVIGPRAVDHQSVYMSPAQGHGGSGVRHISEGPAHRLNRQPTIPPIIGADVGPVDMPPPRPPRLADFATPRDGLGRLQPPAVHDLLGLGQDTPAIDTPAVNRLGIPRLPERGFSLGDVQRVAAALHAVAQPEPGGRVQIICAFGARTFPNLHAAAAALNARSLELQP